MSSLPSLRCWFELWVTLDDLGDNSRVRPSSNQQMRLLYISEKVTGTLNPEWTKLEFMEHSAIQRITEARFVVKAQEVRSEPKNMGNDLRFVPELDQDWDDYSQVTVGQKKGKPVYLSLPTAPSLPHTKTNIKQLGWNNNQRGGKDAQLSSQKKSLQYGKEIQQTKKPNGFSRLYQEAQKNQMGQETGVQKESEHRIEIQDESSIKPPLKKVFRHKIDIEPKEIRVDLEFEQVQSINGGFFAKVHVFFQYLNCHPNMDTMLSPITRTYTNINPYQNRRLRQAPLSLIDEWVNFNDMYELGHISLGGFTGVFQPNSLLLKVGRKFFVNKRPWIGQQDGGGGYQEGNLWKWVIWGKKPTGRLNQGGTVSILPTPRKKHRHRRAIAKTASFTQDLSSEPKYHYRGVSRGGHMRNASGGTPFSLDLAGFDSWAQNGSPSTSHQPQETYLAALGYGGPATTSENRSEISGQEGTAFSEGTGMDAKRYEEDDFIMELKKIKDCENHLHNKLKRRDALHSQLQQALQQQNLASQQKLVLDRKKVQLQQLQKKKEQIQQLMQQRKKEIELRRQMQVQQVRAMRNVLDVILTAVDWMNNQGQDEVKRLVSACSSYQTQIVSRRCNMVVGLAHIFKVGPKTLSVWQGPTLEESLDRWWMMPLQENTFTPSTIVREENDDSSPEQKSTVMQELAMAQSEWYNLGVQYKQVAQLTICDLDLDQRLVNLARDNVILQDQKIVQKTAAALGFIAHLVNKIAAYLAVPLRYPLIYLGSKSFIVDPAPPHMEARAWAQHHPHDSQRLAKDPRLRHINCYREPNSSEAVSATMSTWQDVVLTQNFNVASRSSDCQLQCDSICFPLYYAPRKGMHFDYAIFKLNTDIEQLLVVYGMTSESPIKVLQNLQKLIEHAKAGLPSM